MLSCIGLWAAEGHGQPLAYVANDVSHNVTVFDTATNTVVSTIDVGSANNPASVVVSPDGHTVYVANNPVIHGEGTVSVIDAATQNIVGTIQTGGGPYGIAITPDGATLYVTNFYALPADNVFVIDTASQTVIQSIAVGSFPHGIAISKDGASVYVTNAFSNTVSVIDTVTNTVTATIPVGTLPHGISLSPDGSFAYVSNRGSGSISVLDTNTNAVIGTIPLTAGLEGVAFSQDGSRAYVCHQQADFVSIIDTATNTVIGTISVGINPFGMALGPDGRYLYVANQGSANVSVIDTETTTVVASVPTAPGSFPENLAIAPISTVPFARLVARATIVLAPGSRDRFDAEFLFSPGANNDGIDPLTEDVTVTIGPASWTIPAGWFLKSKFGPALFDGLIDGTRLGALFVQLPGGRWGFAIIGSGALLDGVSNPVALSLRIGNDIGSTTIAAWIIGR
jgi:YVTN family beta-propeller protein